MFAKTSEILKMMREGDILEPTAEDQKKVIGNPEQMKFLGMLCETTLYQSALGLLIETTNEYGGKNGTVTKVKNLAPDFKSLMEVLKVAYPEKYGKGENDESIVRQFIKGVLAVEEEINGGTNIQEPASE